MAIMSIQNQLKSADILFGVVFIIEVGYLTFKSLSLELGFLLCTLRRSIVKLDLAQFDDFLVGILIEFKFTLALDSLLLPHLLVESLLFVFHKILTIHLLSLVEVVKIGLSLLQLMLIMELFDGDSDCHDQVTNKDEVQQICQVLRYLIVLLWVSNDSREEKQVIK